MRWKFVAAATSVLFVLWVAEWRPYYALIVGVSVALPMLLIIVVAKVLERFHHDS
jgi:hypothetical protein